MDSSTQKTLAPQRFGPMSLICLVLGVYVVFLAALGSRYHWNPSALIGLKSEAPLNTPGMLPSGLVVFQGAGYDGQYFYHIALELIRGAPPQVDPFRYQRIGYPLLSALLAFGQEQWIPASMLVVNLLAVAGGTWMFIRLLDTYGLYRWYSLWFALNPGQILGLQGDLAFPLQSALCAGSLLLWERQRLLASSTLLAASILTSESSVLFLLPMVLGEMLRRRWSAAFVLALAVAPYLAYQWLLDLAIGAGGIGTSASTAVLPFSGMGQVLAKSVNQLSAGPLPLARQGAVVGMMIFMFTAAVVSVRKLGKGYDVYTGGVLFHAVFSFFAIYAIWEAYGSAGRVFSGVFPLLVLSHGLRPGRGTGALLLAAAVLSLFTLLRPFTVTPAVPFFVTP